MLFQDHEGVVLSVSFSTDGVSLASGGSDEIVRMWDLRHPDSRPALLKGHQGAVLSLAFSHDGARLASASSDSTVRIWDPRDLRASTVLLKGQDSFFSAAFSPDLASLASIRENAKAVRIWDLRRTTPALPRLLDDGIMDGLSPQANRMSVAFSPDGARLALASAGARPRVQLWNLRNPMDASLTRTHQSIGSAGVAFSPDSARLAFGPSVEGRGVQLWDLRKPGEPPLVLPGEGLPVPNSLAFSPNGTRLASLERATGRVVMWRLWSEAADYLCTRVWRNLSLDEWRFYVGENIPYERTCPSLPPGTGVGK